MCVSSSSLPLILILQPNIFVLILVKINECLHLIIGSSLCEIVYENATKFSVLQTHEMFVTKWKMYIFFFYF